MERSLDPLWLRRRNKSIVCVEKGGHLIHQTVKYFCTHNLLLHDCQPVSDDCVYHNVDHIGRENITLHKSYVYLEGIAVVAS